MKNTNIIDLTGYFAQAKTPQMPQAKMTIFAAKLCHAAGRALNIAATAAIALCVCACTLLFFTML